ncbi:MAG TPA: malto-oligosyltrehalose trehalohydrolase [Solirubrobacteraceae bacterium]|nr:malto-oligosyltrehalose trehalohydrolase [Solirubrobacteraceae bacterium]
MSSGAGYPGERPLGARPAGDGLTDFRVWAPRHEAVDVRVGSARHALAPEGHGVYAARVPAAPGEDYRFVLGRRTLPDPCSRWQPDGLRGPSRVVDTGAFDWTDGGWPGLGLAGLVLYELHVGAFTPEGTFDAVIPHLPDLAALGVTAIEVMPIAEFPGARNWGYDGVLLSAAHAGYGGPLAFQRLVDAAHAAGLGVILDVVYNHIGVSGVRLLEAFGPYASGHDVTTWGRTINFDEERCDPVREWVLQSAEGWVRDFHVDGLRLDAIHTIRDGSARPILREIADRARGTGRPALVIAESGRNDPVVLRPARVGGLGHDAAWADDFHHALHALLTGEREGWYADFGSVAQLAQAFDRPHVLDGRYSAFRRRRFGAPAGDVPRERFVVYSQNHDQVGNRARGDRLPAAARPLAAFCTLLAPFTPLLFMGEEYGEDAPFRFFTDHPEARIAEHTRTGRRAEFAQFSAFAGVDVPDPQDPATFTASRLTRRRDERLAALYRALLDARRSLPAGECGPVAFDEEARWLRAGRGPFALACNFGDEPTPVPAGEAREIVLATHDGATLRDGDVELPALAGALLR